LLEIKWLLGRYFAEKATADMDQIIKEKGLRESDFVEKSKEHNLAKPYQTGSRLCVRKEAFSTWRCNK